MNRKVPGSLKPLIAGDESMVTNLLRQKNEQL